MNKHELAKAAADATIPEDMDGVTHRQRMNLWYVARDAALFALEELEQRDREQGDAELAYHHSVTCACTAAERHVHDCPKHGLKPA